MTLPPLPEPDTHCWDDDTSKDVWSHSEQQMRAYAEQAVAAERERCAHPPQQHKPLTREQIDAIWSAQGSFTDRESDYRTFARAIERAITGEPT